MTPTDALREGMYMALVLAKVNGSPVHEHLGDLLDAVVPDTIANLPEGWVLVPEGKALAALVEAAEAWRGEWVPVVPDGASTPQDMGLLRAIDAYREATK